MAAKNFPSKEYFEKIEHGTCYRVYLVTLTTSVMVVRSALDAVEDVHGELVDRINGMLEAIIDDILKAHSTEAVAMIVPVLRKLAIMEMKHDGWTFISK